MWQRKKAEVGFIKNKASARKIKLDQSKKDHLNERLSWDQYFMRITQVVAERSTCLRAKVGAAVVKDKRIVATGYNGAPSGMPHCSEAGCLIYTSLDPEGVKEENCYRTIHAEINAIAQAAKNGVDISNADFYITHSPCIQCLKVLINTSVKRIYYLRPYKLEKADYFVKYSKVELRQVEMPEQV